MKITYIHHSSFAVSLSNVNFLFDYYKGELPSFDPAKHLYVFASHKHHDHFDLTIFNLALTYPHITYVLSSDIRMSPAYLKRKDIPKAAVENMVFLNKDTVQTFQEEGPSPLIVETLASTDAGVAFILRCEGKQLYHAGDLNWWTWEGESKEEELTMKNAFIREMKKIEGTSFDAAFLPLDPRQENRYDWGFDYFMRITSTKMAFPMHFWKNYKVINTLLASERSKPYRNRIISITEEGQEF